MIYTMSVRGKSAAQHVCDFLAEGYRDFAPETIESLFGFAERSTLYGGRFFTGPQLTDRDIKAMYDMDIGFRIPLTNHFVSLEEYKENRTFLEKYHREGNSIIATNDDLAKWVRQDFPKYRVEASVIKNIDSLRKIDKALALYDTVILPMRCNEQMDFLRTVSNKDRVTLFANAGCALTCPSHLCYPSFSKMNKFTGAKFQCSQGLKERQMRGMVDFDLNVYWEMGFRRFKVLRSRRGGKTGH